MSVVNPTIEISGDQDQKAITFASMANGDTGAPVGFQDFADRSVQVVGTFGSGGSVSLQGSNDGTNWATLKDPQGDDITFVAAGLAQVTEITKHVRPAVTAGDGATALTVTLFMRRFS